MILLLGALSGATSFPISASEQTGAWPILGTCADKIANCPCGASSAGRAAEPGARPLCCQTAPNGELTTCPPPGAAPLRFRPELLTSSSEARDRIRPLVFTARSSCIPAVCSSVPTSVHSWAYLHRQSLFPHSHNVPSPLELHSSRAAEYPHGRLRSLSLVSAHTTARPLTLLFRKSRLRSRCLNRLCFSTVYGPSAVHWAAQQPLSTHILVESYDRYTEFRLHRSPTSFVKHTPRSICNILSFVSSLQGLRVDRFVTYGAQ